MRGYDSQLLERARLLIDASKDGRVPFTREDYQELVCLAYGITEVTTAQTRTVSTSVPHATMLLGMAKRAIAQAVKERIRS